MGALAKRLTKSNDKLITKVYERKGVVKKIVKTPHFDLFNNHFVPNLLGSVLAYS